jgi:hypothetical protein
LPAGASRKERERNATAHCVEERADFAESCGRDIGENGVNATTHSFVSALPCRADRAGGGRIIHRRRRRIIRRRRRRRRRSGGGSSGAEAAEAAERENATTPF